MNNRKKDPLVNAVLWFVVGFGLFLGLIALLVLLSGDIDAFFGIAVTGAGFSGLGWAGRKLLLPAKEGQPPIDVGKVAGTIFAGAGFCMILGSTFLLIDEEIEGAIGLAIFGLVFCVIGYVGYRIFRIPEGKKRILVSERLQQFRGTYGHTGQRKSQQYVYVNENMPESEIKEVQTNWSEKPWTQRKDWAEGKVIQEGAQSFGFLIGFTILWNLLSWGITAYAFITEWETGDVPWFMLIFPFVGFILIVTTFRTWIRRRKFGISVMKLDTLPAYLGDRLRGNIKTGVSALDDPARSFQVKFICAQRKSSRDSKGKKRVSEKKLWSEEHEVYAQLSESMDTLNVSIYFDVPSDLPPTELIPADDRILWRINITSEVPGVDYAAQFEVPVYQYKSEAQNTK
jgi:hypothetical protein